jgi:HK97 family phage major capsid protein
MTLKELREKYAAKIAEARAALANGATPESRTKYDAIMAELAEIGGDINRLTALETADAEERTRQEAEERARLAGRPALPQPGAHNANADNRSAEERDREHRTALLNYMRTGDSSELRATQQSTVGANGGYSIPTTLLPELERALLTFGGVAAHVRSLRTATGEPINWPTSNNNSLAATVLAENTAQSEVQLTMGTKQLAVSTLVTGIVKVPFQLMQDAIFDWESFARTELGEAYARGLANYVGGTSTDASFDALPSIVTSSVTSAAPTAIGLPDITSLFGAVDVAYAQNGSFVMNRSTQLYLASLRNTYGTPIFPLDADGMLTKIYGRPIVIDTTIANIGATNRAVLFGDLSKYILRQVPGLEIKRLDERYAELGQIAFLGFFRAGSRYLNAGTNPIQALVQHA